MSADPYYYGRAEAALRMAQAAHLSAVVKAHYDLANLYLARCYAGSVAPPIVPPGASW